MGKIADLFFESHLQDKNLQLEAVKAGDKAGSTMGQRMQGRLTAAGTSLFAGIGAAGAAAAFSVVDKAISGTIGFLGDAVDAAKEEEVSIDKLGAALRANIKDWDGNTQAIEDVIAARMDLGFSDDEQRDSLAKIIAVTQDYNKALDIQRIAMDLARLRGLDLATAGDIVAKVYGGNIGILSRYGIQLKKGITPTAALLELQTRLAGQAEEWAETNKGDLLVSQIKVGEAMEKLGARILPLVADGMELVADLAVPLIEGVAGVADAVGQLNDIVTELGPANREAAESADILGSKTTPLGQAIHWLADSIRLGLLPAEERAKVMQAELATAFKDSSVDIVEANRASMTSFGKTAAEFDKKADEIVQRAGMLPGELANALRDNRSAWQKSVDQLASDLENEMTTAAEIALIRAELAGENIARGLKSKDPIVRAQAEATRKALADRLALLEGDARRAGANAGQGLATGLNSKQGAVANSALNLARIASKYLKVSSPAELGPWSEGGGPEGWGETFGETLAAGIRRKVAEVREAVGMLAGAGSLTPALAGVSVPSASRFVSSSATATAAPTAVTRINNLDVKVEGLLRAEDPFEVGTRLQRFMDAGVFDTEDDR